MPNKKLCNFYCLFLKKRPIKQKSFFRNVLLETEKRKKNPKMYLHEILITNGLFLDMTSGLADIVFDPIFNKIVHSLFSRTYLW